MTEPAAQIDVPDPAPVDAETVAAVVADMMSASSRPLEETEEETELDSALRFLDRERREASARVREAREAAAREQERQRREAEQQAEAARVERARVETVKRDMQERSAQRERDRQAQAERDRLARIEAQQRAEQVRREQEARENAKRKHWQELDALSAGLSRMLNPPLPDPTAERIAELEWQLAAQAEEAAAEQIRKTLCGRRR